MRISLTSDSLILSKIISDDERKVTIKREKGIGFGLHIKGGSEHGCPILISGLMKGGPADRSRELFVGDVIIAINGQLLENASHDEAIRLLKSFDSDIELSVKHQHCVSSLIKHWKRQQEIDEKLKSHKCIKEGNFFAKSLISDRRWDLTKVLENSDNSKKIHELIECREPNASTNNGEKWVTFVTVNLMCCCFTKYINSSDKVHENGFEARWITLGDKESDNVSKHFSSAVISCSSTSVYKEWSKVIQKYVLDITLRVMKVLNKNFANGDEILYMGWISQKIMECERGQGWKIKYIVIKGGDVYLYNRPPEGLLRGEEVAWFDNKPEIFHVYQSFLRALRDSELIDNRDNCMILLSSSGEDVGCYFSLETNEECKRFKNSWNKATYYSVKALGSKTFSVLSEGKVGTLTLDWKLGFAFYNPLLKKYDWIYKFSRLKNSSDDRRNTLWLCFKILSPDGWITETREVTCNQLQSLLYCIYAFIIAKVISVDPDFLHNS